VESVLPETQTLPAVKARPAVDPSRRLLTVDEVAAQLNTSRYTIWRLRDAGRFPAPIKIGASSRWKQSDVDDFVAASRCAPGDTGLTKRKPGRKATRAAEVRP
jgi:excisionase family DNA binding protein